MQPLVTIQLLAVFPIATNLSPGAAQMNVSTDPMAHGDCMGCMGYMGRTHGAAWAAWACYTIHSLNILQLLLPLGGEIIVAGAVCDQA